MPMAPVNLNVDFSTRTGDIRPMHSVNLGPVQMNGWMDTSDMYREMNFPLVRLHDCQYAVPETVDVHCIFPLFDADPHDPRNYRFAISDDYIQSILDTGSQIVYRLGETIEHHTRRHYFVHPPKDFQKWATICVNIIRHYNDGWADGFHHNIRYWEIWNEPWISACWEGTHEQYFQLYEIAAKAIKAHDPNLKVGGPTALCGTGPEDFGEKFVKHCQLTGAPLDFYSWHIYTPEPTAIVEDSHKVRDLLKRYGFDRTENHLNEWSYLPTEGFRFNSIKKDPLCIKRAEAEISGAPGAAFDAAMLIYMQDCPIDVAMYYWALNGLWGFLDNQAAPRKNYHAFKAFRTLLNTPRRAKSTTNDPATGYALLAGASDEKQANILLANARARQSVFAVTLAKWPWSGKAVCKQYILDEHRDLLLANQSVLDESSSVVTLNLPAPAVALLTLSPEA
ncbi:MAG: hypothetical protein IT440_14085 [Phycisphaeraceae bacterium]|nr:hypothetical protein [Phycisphaeraceae bacterium]